MCVVMRRCGFLVSVSRLEVVFSKSNVCFDGVKVRVS